MCVCVCVCVCVCLKEIDQKYICISNKWNIIKENFVDIVDVLFLFSLFKKY